MRVLIASKRKPGTPGRRDGGVQTWISTVAAELHRLGHAVVIADQHNGPGQTFDIGIFANSAYTAAMAGSCTRSVLVSHGIVPDEEPKGPFGAVLFTSEEVRDHWAPSTANNIVRQPIDLQLWKPLGLKHQFLQRFANRSGLSMLPGVARALGMRFQHLRSLNSVNACKALNQARCVVASGRCAVEAMACGVPVVICDDRHYQGPLLDSDTLGAMKRNYSGRGGVTPTLKNIQQAVIQAIAKGSLRSHVEQYHDASKITAQLLAEAA